MDGRFTRSKLDDVVRQTCVLLGLDGRDATLIRLTNNAVYSLAHDPVVVRIVASHALRYRAHRVVTVADHLARHGVPAVRLLDGPSQPLNVENYTVTVWQKVPESGGEATSADLAGLLRQVHALPPPHDLDFWSPLTDVRARVADAEELASDERAFLLRRCAEIEAELAELPFPLPVALLHGDAHPGNVIVGRHGPVLCDFDSSCIGPPEWDLTPLAVGQERFGDPRVWYRALADEYGFDVTQWDGFRVLRTIRELKLTTSVLPILRSRPSVRQEFRRRLDDLRHDRISSRWLRY